MASSRPYQSSVRAESCSGWARARLFCVRLFGLVTSCVLTRACWRLAGTQLHLPLALLPVLLLSGCQSASKQQLAAISRFESGDIAEAYTCLEEAEKKRGAESNLIAVDKAILLLISGDPARSESTLRDTRKQLDHLRQKNLAEETKSTLTDETAVSWSAREFEQRMIDNLLVLSSLMGDRQDAVAYTNQVMMKVSDDKRQLESEIKDDVPPTAGYADVQQTILPVPGKRLAPNAFSAYLQAAVHSEKAMDSDLTDRAIRQVGFWAGADTSNASVAPALTTTAAFGTQTKRNHGTLHIITFVGRVTDWTPETAAPTSAALLMADRLLSAIGDHTLPPTIAPVQIGKPRKQFSQSPYVTTAAVVHPDSSYGSPVTCRTIVDLNAAAWDSYLADRNRQIARAVVRRIVKKSAVYAAKDQLSVNSNTGVDLIFNLGGMAWEALEKPDTRHVTLLPERIEAAQLELPAGDHSIRISSVGDLMTISSGQPHHHNTKVTIEDGRNTFLLCFLAGTDLHVTVPANF